MVTLRIALRYLLSKKSHSAVNHISVISMIGVAVATIAIVCVLSVFNGFRDLAESRLSAVDPELKVQPAGGKIIADADSLARAISVLASVDTAVATIDEQALAIVGPHQMAVRMYGVPLDYGRLSAIGNTIIDGEFALRHDSTACAVLSVGTAIRLGARPDIFAPLALYVPRRKGRVNPSNPMTAFRSDSLLVAGVFEVDESDKDASTIYVPLDLARRMLDYTTEATAIEVTVAPTADVASAKADITALCGLSLTVKDRLEQEEQSFRMIAIEKWLTFIMLAFILLIASFNVISTLSMLMLEKADNMTTLRALGARRSTVRNIFVWEGWLISLIGGLAGTVAGVALCLIQMHFGIITLAGDASQLSITAYPVKVEAIDLLVVMGLVMLTGLFIAVVTSRFAPRR